MAIVLNTDLWRNFLWSIPFSRIQWQQPSSTFMVKFIEQHSNYSRDAGGIRARHSSKWFEESPWDINAKQPHVFLGKGVETATKLSSS